MSEHEHKPHAKPKPSTLSKSPETEPKDAPKAGRTNEADKKQREAIDYDNHEDYPNGSKASDAPAKRSEEQSKDELPDRRRREPDLKP